MANHALGVFFRVIFHTSSSIFTDPLSVTAPNNSKSGKIGPGSPLGAPPTAPTASVNGAGVLNGSYSYCYTESDRSGETTCSPIVTQAATNNTIRLNIPRGVSQRSIYRENPGDTVYRKVHDFGSGYFQNLWDDNTPDATVASAAPAPTADSTALYNLEINKSVKFFRTHPDQGVGPADVTILTSNPSVSGAYAIDSYGPIMSRTYLANAFQSVVTGQHGGSHFSAYYEGDVEGGVNPYRVYYISPIGQHVLTPTQLPSNGGMLSANATFNSANTASTSMYSVTSVGAGNAAYTQYGISSFMQPGYTGTSATAALNAVNTTASAGSNYGLLSNASGASALTVGVLGLAQTGTKNIGMYGSGGGNMPESLTFPGGISAIGGAFSNGTGTGDIIVGFANNTPVFRVINTGDVNITGPSTNSATSLNVSVSGKGNFFIKANGNSDVELGSSNNVPVNFYANSAVAWTLGTDKSLTGAATANLKIPSQKATSGTRYVCIDTNGQLVSSATACSGS